ncbi:putative enoyl-CoA hydratase echA8 [Pigmentiphaga humi]|uniref:Putative enoyl-CoA hydratase echA8 n=1 Tax=Pigmentiphaga humi TaxID=2478468 RepID=A0A3P4B9P2_9BURK|nr:enoyl-CoA hydratase-related protein [Pigmentiphaga humi]VCU72246.1 putative enoyl-CoA hydratase echA8 [Pigmentiphaga humi]
MSDIAEERTAEGQGRILVADEGSVRFVTLAHPGKLNALGAAMWRGLAGAIQEAAGQPGLRCVVIRGEGKDFAAGADIAEFPALRGTREAVRHYHESTIAPALRAIAECPLPTVAMIRGICVGGGLEIACSCDLRVAARSARLGAPIGRLGFPMAPAELSGLLAVAGRATTLELLLEGRLLDAAEAYAKGLLTRVVDEGELEQEVSRTVARIAAGAPLAATLNKSMVRRLAAAQPLTEEELAAFFDYSDTPDHHKGVAAFLEGRQPAFGRPGRRDETTSTTEDEQ